MLEVFQKKVEILAEEYADFIRGKILQGGNLNEINEGIRMLNHIACTLERIDRMQREIVICGQKNSNDQHCSHPLKSVGQPGTKPSSLSQS